VAGRPYVLAETTWSDVRVSRYEVALLPWGATEAHNLHLPYATDVIESERVAIESARRAWERGARVVVLPPIPFGVNTGQLDIPLCINMNPSTQLGVLRDVAESLAGQGVRKLVIVNGHGGNDFKPLIRELQPRVAIFLCTLDWWTAVDARAHFDVPGDHGGELETSAMLHLAPELVLPLEEAGEGHAHPWAVRGLRDGLAWAPRQWTRATDDTGVGDPRAATAEKGRRFVDAACERIAEFLAELAVADPEAMYDRPVGPPAAQRS
jgi:creatinine amidohydrolase